MDARRRLEIELPEEMADGVRARVASGEFASESEVVRAGLELLDEQEGEHDPEVDAQLAAGFDAWKANPTGGMRRSPEPIARLLSPIAISLRAFPIVDVRATIFGQDCRRSSIVGGLRSLMM